MGLQRARACTHVWRCAVVLTQQTPPLGTPGRRKGGNGDTKSSTLLDSTGRSH